MEKSVNFKNQTLFDSYSTMENVIKLTKWPIVILCACIKIIKGGEAMGIAERKEREKEFRKKTWKHVEEKIASG